MIYLIISSTDSLQEYSLIIIDGSEETYSATVNKSKIKKKFN